MNEEISKELEKHRRLLNAKLDAVYFDDEIDEIKGLITVVSEMTSGTSQTQKMIDNVKKSNREKRAASNQGGARISEEQKIELETMLKEFPYIHSKQKSISKALEGLNIENLKE